MSECLRLTGVKAAVLVFSAGTVMTENSVGRRGEEIVRGREDYLSWTEKVWVERGDDKSGGATTASFQFGF